MSLARRAWTLYEPIHAIVYFAPEAPEAYKAAGLRGGWMGYFASRSAPMGAVSRRPRDRRLLQLSAGHGCEGDSRCMAVLEPGAGADGEDGRCRYRVAPPLGRRVDSVDGDGGSDGRDGPGASPPRRGPAPVHRHGGARGARGAASQALARLHAASRASVRRARRGTHRSRSGRAGVAHHRHRRRVRDGRGHHATLPRLDRGGVGRRRGAAPRPRDPRRRRRAHRSRGGRSGPRSRR